MSGLGFGAFPGHQGGRKLCKLWDVHKDKKFTPEVEVAGTLPLTWRPFQQTLQEIMLQSASEAEKINQCGKK